MATRPWRYHAFKARNWASDTLENIEVPEAVKKARVNFNAFAEYISGLTQAEHHKEWARFWVTYDSNHLLNQIAGEDVSILAPRGSGKSTALGLFIAYAIGHNPHIQIIYLGYGADVALSRSRLIKRIIESKKYQEVFPHIRPSKKRWSDGEWEIDKEFAGVDSLNSDFTLYATGVLGTVVSKRSHLIVYDDLIKSRKTIKNPEIRKEMSTNLQEAVEPTLIPGGRKLSIGTRFIPNDLHVTDLIPEKGWKQIEQSAIVIDPKTGAEKSYWPQRFSLQYLQKLRHKSPETFSFQYQNKVVRVAEISIDPSWIVYGRTPDFPDKIGIGMDLSGKASERADYTALTIGCLANNKVSAMEAVRGRWPGNLDKIDRILEMCVEWGIIDYDPSVTEEEIASAVNGLTLDNRPIYVPGDMTCTIYAEAVAYQTSFEYDFKRIVKNKLGLWNLNCKGVSVRGDKDLRLKSVTGLFQDGLIEFNESREMGDLIEELISFGSTPHDDLADSFVLMVRGLVRRTKLNTGVDSDSGSEDKSS